MALRITEFFGYHPYDRSEAAQMARASHRCPFSGLQCTKLLSVGPSGACTLMSASGEEVICCPQRLYGQDHLVLKQIASEAFGPDTHLVSAGTWQGLRGDGRDVAVFGKGWGKELRLPRRGNKGSYYVDWILALLDDRFGPAAFVAVEVQSIDTTGNYQDERAAYLNGAEFDRFSVAGFNWENVSKRILPQLIYKGNVLQQEPLCSKGLFFVSPSSVYRRVTDRLGGELTQYPQQLGSLTFRWYGLSPGCEAGSQRELRLDGELVTLVHEVAQRFNLPPNLPEQRVYENAIRQELASARPVSGL